MKTIEKILKHSSLALVSLLITAQSFAAGPSCSSVFDETLRFQVKPGLFEVSKLYEIELPTSLQVENPLEARANSSFYKILSAFDAPRSSRWLKDKVYASETSSETSSITEILEAGVTYNLVISKNKVYLASMNDSLLSNWLTKHYVISGHANDVAFAGEVMKTPDGLLIVNNNSGTYRPAKSQVEQFEDLFAMYEGASPSTRVLPKEPLKLKLPSETQLQIGIENIRSRFNAADILQTLSAVEKEPSNPENILKLKAHRKNLSLLRGLSQSFTKEGKASFALTRTTHLMGDIVDQIASGQIAKAKFTSLILKTFLRMNKKIIPDKIELDPTAAASHIFKFEKGITKYLSRYELSAEEFHILRLNFKKYLGLLMIKKDVTELSKDESEALTLLYDINEKLGSIHDEMIDRAMKGEIKYEKHKYQMSDELRIELLQAQKQLMWE